MKSLEEIVQKWEAKAQKIIAGLQTNYNSDQIRRLDSLQGCISDLNDYLQEQKATQPKPMTDQQIAADFRKLKDKVCPKPTGPYISCEARPA